MVRAACAGGVRAVMLREKDLPTPQLVALGVPLRDACRDAGVTFLVNHDLDAAAELGADGVHLGYRSASVAEARAALGGTVLVGRSTHDDAELDDARTAGADYVTFGPIHDTPSKRGLLSARGMERLAAAVARVHPLPVVALGGLSADDASSVRRSGAAGIAAIRALVAAPDPGAAAQAFLAAWGSDT